MNGVVGVPEVLQCPVVLMMAEANTSILSKKSQIREENFEGSVCITCMDTGRDALPWSELFTKGRQT